MKSLATSAFLWAAVVSPCLGVVLFLPSPNLPSLNDVILPPPPPSGHGLQHQQGRFLQVPPHLQRQHRPHPHFIPAVHKAAMEEQKLPRELRNPFYADPALASRLADASRPTPEEMVLRMDQWNTNKVPRHKIIGLLKDAGLA